MVGALTPIYGGGFSLSIQGICTLYRGRLSRARWGQNSRSVAQPGEYFRGGARAIGTLPGKHWAVRCRATALRSPYRHFSLGHEANVIQLVSYSPHTTLLLSHSYCITVAAQEELVVAQLASPLTSHFSWIFPVLPFLSIYRTSYHVLSDTSSHMHMHVYILPISSYTPSSVEWCYVDWCWFWKSKP